MAVLKVRKYGDPALRRTAMPVGEVTPEVRAIIADMTETMYDEVGIGLAAPQVGISLRLIVVADEEGRGVQALLNPVIVDRGGEVTGEEGCLSIPGIFAPVTRAASVKVEARSVDGQPLTLSARGLRARVLQHEIDHLDGVLFIDRVDPMVRDRIKRKIKKEGLREDASRHAFAL
ncbi:MAG: peptide deformylase [Candidatus Rokuibacteriota bacterium]|nr:MAG: peptide deformylase [Candidatus Rokubacteria bacterium]